MSRGHCFYRQTLNRGVYPPPRIKAEFALQDKKKACILRIIYQNGYFFERRADIMREKDKMNCRLSQGASKFYRKNRCGFTLVELMIVIVIMVILAAAATPIFKGYVERAKLAKYYEEMHQVIQAGEIARTEALDAQDLMSGSSIDITYPPSPKQSYEEIAFSNALESYLDASIANRTNYIYTKNANAEPVIFIRLYLKERNFYKSHLLYKEVNGEPGEITYNPGN